MESIKVRPCLSVRLLMMRTRFVESFASMMETCLFISSDATDLEWINDFATGKIEKGLTTGLSNLDKYYLFKKEFTIINGHSNVGKTTMALYMMVTSSVLHKWEMDYIFFENKTAAVKMRLMEFLVDVTH